MAQRRTKRRRKQQGFFERINPLYWLAIVFAVLLVLALGLYIVQQQPTTTTGASQPASAKPQPAGNIPYPNVPRIPLADAKAKLDRQEVVMVDSRTAEEFAQAHIPGAVSIPLSETEQRLSQLPRDKEIITYCT